MRMEKFSCASSVYEVLYEGSELVKCTVSYTMVQALVHMHIYHRMP